MSEPVHPNAVLADFRAWLAALPPDAVPAPVPAPPVDLLTLVGQFTALRHEVNLQTRASRTAVEQTQEVVQRLTAAKPEVSDGDAALKPVVKALLDIVDALTRGAREAEAKADEIRERFAAPDEPVPTPGLFARLFRPAPPTGSPAADAEWAAKVAASLSQGYALSLRRVEVMLPLLRVEAIEAVGRAFDPETMEAVGVVEVSDDDTDDGDGGGAPRPGSVAEEVRAGYLWRGKLLRAAQVRVAAAEEATMDEGEPGT